MRTVAVMPLKLNNERLPGKNTRLLGNKPLLHYELEALMLVEELDGIYVYCSNEQIREIIPAGITFLKRPEFLDLPTSNFHQIFEEFMKVVDADIYVYSHATAPFISVQSIHLCIEAVKSGVYDSAFTATRIQDYLWRNGSPVNFDARNLPRSQDLEPIYRETSGVYVFTKEVFLKYRRRIGIKPYIREVTAKEAVDINEPIDFRLAELMLEFKG